MTGAEKRNIALGVIAFAAVALLPLIDMCNHDFGPNAAVSGSSDSSALNLRALRDIAPGEDVTLSYGNLPNDFLLLDYGFVVENNAHDNVKLSFDPSFKGSNADAPL